MSFTKIAKRVTFLARGPVALGSIWSIAIKVAALGLGFLQAILTARLLGPEGYGTIAVALAVATIVATCATLGLGPLAVREVARLSVRADWSELRGFLRFSGLAVIGASIVAGGAIAALALWSDLFGASYRREIAMASILVLPLAMLFYFRGVFQGFGQVLAAQLPGDLLRPIVLVGGLGFLFVTASPATTTSYLVIAIGAGFSAAIVAVMIFRGITAHRIPTASQTLHPRQWRRAATPFLAMAVFGVFGGEVNTLLLGWLSGPAETGLFQPVARIAPLMLIGLQAVSVPFAPRVATLWEQGAIAALHRTTWLVTLTTTGATVLTGAAIVVLAPLILSAFGKVFLVAIDAILVVAVAQIFNAACGSVGMLLSMTGHQGTVARCQIAGLTSNLLLGIWLIPSAGVYGAAIAFSGSVVVSNILMLVAVKRILGFNASLLGARYLVVGPDAT